MRTRRTRTFAALWLLPLLIGMLALALPGIASAAPTGAIAGTVALEGGASPEEVVEACAEGSAATGYEFHCGKVEADGTYEIVGLVAGEYTVLFWVYEGFNYVPEFWEGTPIYSSAQHVAVAAGVTTPGVDGTLPRGGTISGTVTAAATGAPVSGVEACASSAAIERCGMSNAAGSYTIDGLAPGSWSIYFYPAETNADVVAQPYTGGPVTLPAQGAVGGVNAALQAGGQIAGTVRLAATGAPLAGVRVCITEAVFDYPLGCLTSPKSGGYRFLGLWASSFKVVFSPEAGDFEEAEASQFAADAYPTQWWNAQPNFAAATSIAITPPGVVSGVDASLGPPPAPPAAPVTATPPVIAPVMKKKPVLKCRRGFVKRKVKGKQRCLKRHKRVRHHKHTAKGRKRST